MDHTDSQHLDQFQVDHTRNLYNPNELDHPSDHSDRLNNHARRIQVYTRIDQCTREKRELEEEKDKSESNSGFTICLNIITYV